MESTRRQKPSQKARFAAGGAVTTLIGLVVTFLLLVVEKTPQHAGTLNATCGFNMSSGLTEHYNNVEMIHDEFKRCIFDATHSNQNEFRIPQFTALLDHGTKRTSSFQLYFDVILPKTWHQEKLVEHVRHLFKDISKTFCNYPFAVMQGSCKLKNEGAQL